MTNKPSKKEKTIEKIVQLVCVAITIAGCLLLGSCSMEDVCGNITGFGIDDSGYYIYIDGSREYVTRSTWDQSYLGDYICIGY